MFLLPGFNLVFSWTHILPIKKKKNFMDALQTLFIDPFVPMEFKSHHIGSFFIFSMMLLRQIGLWTRWGLLCLYIRGGS
jgi:hypothetical protein